MRGALLVVALSACSGGSPAPGLPGRCSAPTTITLPFTAPDGSATMGPVDDTQVACAAPRGLPEAVYAFTLTTPGGVQVIADDQFGRGLGIDVREGVDCNAASRFCRWQTTGALDERVALPAGKYVLVLERDPEGPFTLKVQ